MRAADAERRALLAISALTVASGAGQAAAPGMVLNVLGAERSATTDQLFATVGMFMVCVGAGLGHGLARRSRAPEPVLWAAAQKAGACAAVGIGVRRGVFSPLALGVAAFDGASGLLALDYWRRLR